MRGLSSPHRATARRTPVRRRQSARACTAKPRCTTRTAISQMRYAARPRSHCVGIVQLSPFPHSPPPPSTPHLLILFVCGLPAWGEEEKGTPRRASFGSLESPARKLDSSHADLSTLRLRPQGRRVGRGLGDTHPKRMLQVAVARFQGRRHQLGGLRPFAPQDLDAPPLPVAPTGRPLRARPVWPLADRLRRIHDLPRRGCASHQTRRAASPKRGPRLRRPHRRPLFPVLLMLWRNRKPPGRPHSLVRATQSRGTSRLTFRGGAISETPVK